MEGGRKRRERREEEKAGRKRKPGPAEESKGFVTSSRCFLEAFAGMKSTTAARGPF